MSKLELYKEIWFWLWAFHRTRYHHTGLLTDFRNDIWLKLQDKQVNRQYVKKTCYYYPFWAMKSKYYKKVQRSWTSKEIVLVTEKGDYVEFGVQAFEYEIEVPKRALVRKEHKDAKALKVTFLTGIAVIYPSVKDLSVRLGVNKYSVYKRLGKDNSGRYTNRKMSHIKTIEYLE